MSNLLTIPRNGSLARKRTKKYSNFPTMMNLFDDLFYRDIPTVFSSNFSEGISMPKVNIKEGDDSFVIEMAVPGMKKSDFEINLDNNTLSISAKVESEANETENGFVRREFGYTSFNRNFTLPETVDDSKIDAKYSEGILSINIPKREEAKRKPNRIIDIS
jgi:HSP20 family protein